MIPGIQGIHPVLGAAAASTGGAIPPFVNVGTLFTDVTTSTGNPTYPAGIANNDVAILTVLVTDSLPSPGSQAVTTPAGWTLIHTISNTTIPAIVECYGAQFWKRLDGTETGAVVVTLSETTNTYPACMGIAVFRGCTTSATPVEGAAHTVQATNTTQTANAVTTTGPNRTILSHFLAVPVAGTTGTANGSAVEIYEQTSVNAGGKGNFAGYTLDAPTSGVQTAISRTVNNSTGYVSISCALIPA